MPLTVRRISKTSGLAHIRDGHSHTRHLTNQAEHDATKNDRGSWFAVAHNKGSGHSRNPVMEEAKRSGSMSSAGERSAKELDGVKGYAARLGESTISRRYGSKSKARKAASARIAKIPLVLAQHIAHVYHPARSMVA